MNVAAKLKESRVNAGYTQLEVKKKTGINNKSLSNWEKGVSSPSLPDLVALAKLYDVSTDYLLGNDDTPPAQTKQPANTVPILTDAEINLIMELRELPKDSKDYIKQTIKRELRILKDETPETPEPPQLKLAM